MIVKTNDGIEHITQNTQIKKGSFPLFLNRIYAAFCIEYHGMNQDKNKLEKVEKSAYTLPTDPDLKYLIYS